MNAAPGEAKGAFAAANLPPEKAEAAPLAAVGAPEAAEAAPLAAKGAGAGGRVDKSEMDTRLVKGSRAVGAKELRTYADRAGGRRSGRWGAAARALVSSTSASAPRDGAAYRGGT